MTANHLSCRRKFVPLESAMNDYGNEHSDMVSILQATSAEKFASSPDSSEMTLSDSAVEVLKKIESNCHVLIRNMDGQEFGTDCSEDASDFLLTRLGLFKSILEAKSCTSSLASLNFPRDAVCCIRGEDSLSVAAAAMITSNCEVVAVEDEHGVITGVITCAALIAFLRHQRRGPRRPHKLRRRRRRRRRGGPGGARGRRGGRVGGAGVGAAHGGAALRRLVVLRAAHRPVSPRFVPSGLRARHVRPQPSRAESRGAALPSPAIPRRQFI